MTPRARQRAAAPAPPSPARSAALRVLERVEQDAAYADLTLEAELARHRLSPRDIALATELVFGTLRWQRYLDWLLTPYLHRGRTSVTARVRATLRMTVYQLVFLERVPSFAAVSDAVSLARGRPRVAEFVNAVLRAFTRRGDGEPPLPADPLEALAIRCSFPTWLARRWVGRWSLEEARALMVALCERPPLTVRANTLRIDREALRARLVREESLASHATTWAPEGLVLEGSAGSPGSWRAFADGSLVVQDEASMLVAHLLAPRAGETVADVCAAPGAKTSHLAQLMGDRGRVLAFDPVPARLARVRHAVARLGLTSVETLDGAVETLAPAFRARCDAVLVDAPCSNLGVLRRNPEVKWRRTPKDLERNARRQARILDAAAAMVRAGGRLVYATCSLEPEENNDVACAFLGAHPTFRLDPPEAFPLPLDPDGFLRCLPHRHGTDGFSAVRFRRDSTPRVI